MALPREPVTLEQLAERLGVFAEADDGQRILTKKGVRRLARASWQAQRRGLLIVDGAPPGGTQQ